MIANIFFVLTFAPSLLLAHGTFDASQHKDWLKVQVLASPEYCPFQAAMGDKLTIHYQLFLNDENGEKVKTGFEREVGKLFAYNMGSHEVSLSQNNCTKIFF